MFIMYKNGASLAMHSDGTRIYTDKRTEFVGEYEVKRFLVEISHEIFSPFRRKLRLQKLTDQNSH